jgi:formamidopyrimidine-DNA glycosylase
LAEIPELKIFVRQMNEHLTGKTVASVEVLQPKCLNVPVEVFTSALSGKKVGRTSHAGKWIKTEMLPGYHFLLNVQMGADLRIEPPPKKHQVKFTFTDGSAFYCRYWWLGYAHLVKAGDYHKDTAQLGPFATDPEATAEFYDNLILNNPGSTIKSLLLDQKRVSGIGNAYAHDLLFEARIHPRRKCRSLSAEERTRIYPAVRHILSRAEEMGGMEKDLFGQGGEDKSFRQVVIIGYREGEPCPVCGTAIHRIKTGSTQGFICPTCQPI